MTGINIEDLAKKAAAARQERSESYISNYTRAADEAFDLITSDIESRLEEGVTSGKYTIPVFTWVSGRDNSDENRVRFGMVDGESDGLHIRTLTNPRNIPLESQLLQRLRRFLNQDQSDEQRFRTKVFMNHDRNDNSMWHIFVVLPREGESEDTSSRRDRQNQRYPGRFAASFHQRGQGQQRYGGRGGSSRGRGGFRPRPRF